MKKTAIFGLGEAGSLIARDLFAAGVEVRAYDPADVATPEGVIRHENPAAIVRDADMVFALTAAADAVQAMKQALEDIPATAIYADFSTAAAGLKQTLATLAHSAGFAFADVALLAIVPGHGIRATALVSGTGATEFARRMRPFGMPVNEIGDQAGDAATRKLLRSVMMKGLAAVTIEAMRAAQAAGCQDWLWQNLGDEISKANADTLARLVTGSQKHALRRLHEMEASTTLLQELGIDPVMTRCTVASLKSIPELGIPIIPEPKL